MEKNDSASVKQTKGKIGPCFQSAPKRQDTRLLGPMSGVLQDIGLFIMIQH
jgi:hypothetical protein